jgi:hypothetical protein
MAWRSSGQSMRLELFTSMRRTHSATIASCSSEPRSVEIAAPTTPSAGNGPQPKTRMMSKMRLKTLPASIA